MVVGSNVVDEATVVVSVRCPDALAWESSDCVLASRVVSMVEGDTLDVIDVVDALRDEDVLCEDLVSEDVIVGAVTVDMDRLVIASVDCASVDVVVVTASTSALEAVTVMVMTGM